ncbi:MAG: type II toxin-antitoxin system VapB family antitoxin [Rubrivivax sp.]|nr:type II toxin-antitoxin system VapB family antitoxin [Rubrivivax sp.]
MIQSLRERLERVQRSRRTASADELLAIGRRCAQGLRGATVPHGDFLYDERGLPR